MVHSNTEPFENRTLKRSVFEWIPFSIGRNSSPHCIVLHFTLLKDIKWQTWTTGESELHQILTDRAVQKVEQAEPEGVL